MGEVQLLDRVLLKLGLAQDDAELESFIKVYLCPVLLKTGGYSLSVDALQSCFEHALVCIRVIAVNASCHQAVNANPSSARLDCVHPQLGVPLPRVE